MVNKSEPAVTGPIDLGAAPALAIVYVATSVATLAAVAVLAALVPRPATSAAWGHAVIVMIFSVLLPVRLRAARRGRRGALRASVIIAVVVGAVNLVEAVLPGTFPGWLRIDMIVVAGIMVLMTIALVRVRR